MVLGEQTGMGRPRAGEMTVGDDDGRTRHLQRTDGRVERCVSQIDDHAESVHLQNDVTPERRQSTVPWCFGLDVPEFIDPIVHERDHPGTETEGITESFELAVEEVGTLCRCDRPRMWDRLSSRSRAGQLIFVRS